MSRFTTDSKIWSSGASGARTLKELEQANADLKKQLAESVLDNETIKATLNRKY